MDPAGKTRVPENEPPRWNEIAGLNATSPIRLAADSLSAVISTEAGELLIRLYDFGARISSRRQRQWDYGILAGEPAPQPLKLARKNDISTITGATHILKLEHEPLAFELAGRDGKKYCESATDGHFERRRRLPPLAKLPEGWLVSVALRSGEPVYGAGEKWGPLNKRGQLLRSFNTDALGVNSELSYKNAPFVWSPKGWGLFAHGPAPVTHAVGFPGWSHRSYCALVEDDFLDLFLLTDNSENAGAGMLKSYVGLTGPALVPPPWSCGVILSKAYYKDADEILRVARTVRERGMPCDVITFDGRAWQDTATRFAFEWDAKRYPRPEKVLAELKAMDFKICLWEYPMVSVDHPWFEEFAGKGWLIKDRRTGKAYRYDWDQQAFGKVLTPLPKSGIVDFTHPDAYAFWRDAHRRLFELGADMIKADFGEQVTDENMVAHSGDGGLALHNVYANLYNRCIREAGERHAPGKIFILSRAAWSGGQRFSSHWGGDPQADWEAMAASIRGGLSWGMTGGAFYATDIGGFYGDTRDPALYVRWAQAAVFSAHLRFHGIGPREPWSYSEDAAAAVMRALKLRYQLQIYLLDAVRAAAETGLPVQRAMALAFPREPQAWGFENQFLFGDDLLVAPCFDPDGEVAFYLPEGDWVPFAPDAAEKPRHYAGGKAYREKLALEELRVFARAGSKIPIAAAGDRGFGDNPELARHWSAD